ncbi:MAG: PSP1 domain-containing protein [Flavobacteriales bacterium]
MGCSSCSNSGGLPNGCKNNGACGVSGCNKLDVFDWLAGMELPVGQKPYDVVEVRFKNGRKNFYRNSEHLELHIGDVIAVESSPGHDVGIVSLTGELVKTQLSVKGAKDDHELKKVYRKAKEEDVDKWQTARGLEMETMHGARKIASDLGLSMKISDVEYQGDGAKATFFYTAEDRVDFRELIKNLSNSFKVRIEMRQIGMRQEAARLGGIGSCGRELCCSTWLTDFRSVSTSAARYQQLSLNPQKLAGQCGKLKCCLNYELDQYMEAVKHFPKGNIKLQTEVGIAFHFKTDIFKNLMYFIQHNQPGSSPVAISVDDVKEVIAMNERGEKPMSLMDFKIEEFELVEETTYDNVVGQDSLTRFDSKKKRKPKRGGSKSSPRNQKSNKSARSGNSQKGKPSPKGKPSKGPQKPAAKKEGETPKPKRKPRPPRKTKGNQPQGNQKKGQNKPGNKPAK